jgi:plasmid stabilization system protein ParE
MSAAENKAVFPSYALPSFAEATAGRQNAEAAKRSCDALRTAGAGAGRAAGAGRRAGPAGRTIHA